MICMKCKTCGGEMSVDLKGELLCPYCGTKTHFSDAEFSEYKNFRRNMLNYLRAAADTKADKADDSAMWSFCENVVFESETGSQISIDYLFYYIEDRVETYVARESIVFVFGKEDRAKADAFLRQTGMLQYPSADLKGLAKYFPMVKSRIDLKGGGLLLAIAKPENAYPLFAFGNLKAEHAAWIVSRLENICCVLAYSNMVHKGMSINSVFINPRTHEAFLYGGWWNACSEIKAADKTDLIALRKIAGQLLGANSAPAEFRQFLSGRPAGDAYGDFALWDKVIEKGFGGHKFTKFFTD